MAEEGSIEGICAALWRVLRNQLWHATSIRATERIFGDGRIRHDLQDAAYTNAVCRHHGGVSLFDFSGRIEGIIQQQNNWMGWFGHQQRERVAVWLSLNRAALGSALVTPEELLEIWRADHSPRKIIAHVEACHQGPVPVSAITGALAIDAKRHCRFEWFEGREKLVPRVKQFMALLPSEPMSLGDKLDNARERAQRRKSKNEPTDSKDRG